MMIEPRCSMCGRQLTLSWKKVVNRAMVEATVEPCAFCSENSFKAGVEQEKALAKFEKAMGDAKG